MKHLKCVGREQRGRAVDATRSFHMKTTTYWCRDERNGSSCIVEKGSRSREVLAAATAAAAAVIAEKKNMRRQRTMNAGGAVASKDVAVEAASTTTTTTTTILWWRWRLRILPFPSPPKNTYRHHTTPTDPRPPHHSRAAPRVTMDTRNDVTDSTPHQSRPLPLYPVRPLRGPLPAI